MKKYFLLCLGFLFISCATEAPQHVPYVPYVPATELLRSPEKYNQTKLCTVGYAFSYGRGGPTHVIADIERNYFSAPHILKLDSDISHFSEATRLEVCGIITLDTNCFDLQNFDSSLYCAPSVVELREAIIQ